MALCGPGNCDCAFHSLTLNISRDGNLITIEQAQFSAITALEEAVANIEATLATLPATYVNVAGDSMTGALRISCPGGQLWLIRTDSSGPHLNFMAPDGVTRQGYIQHAAGSGFIINDQVDGIIRLYTDNVERVRFTNAIQLINKTASNQATAGQEFHDTGQSYGTVATNIVGHISNRTGTGDVNGGVHSSFRANGTTIGTITQATASTVAYNTSSDEDLKTNIMPVDDELAEWVARIVEPYLFEFKKTPGVVHLGYVAQRVAAVWPESIALGIVTPGYGNIEDRTWDADGNETTPEGVWQQWSMDYGKMTGIIHAAWQSTARKLDALTERVAALEAG